MYKNPARNRSPASGKYWPSGQLAGSWLTGALEGFARCRTDKRRERGKLRTDCREKKKKNCRPSDRPLKRSREEEEAAGCSHWNKLAKRLSRLEHLGRFLKNFNQVAKRSSKVWTSAIQNNCQFPKRCKSSAASSNSLCCFIVRFPLVFWFYCPWC